jgi:NAD+ synthase (glutamine-hydrolysing)
MEKNYGFVRVGAAVPKIEVANCRYNIDSIYELIEKADKEKIAVLTFPELCVTGYTCADLFFQATLLEECEKSIAELLEKTKNIDILITIGAPVKAGYKLYNSAIVIYKGKILCIIPKIFIPNYNEFHEKRWFCPADENSKIDIKYCGQDTVISTNILIQHERIKELCIGVEVCEDVWSPIPPSTLQALAGANLILNLSASTDYVGKSESRHDIVKHQSQNCVSAYVFASAGFGESTTDLVFSGQCLIYENGNLLVENRGFDLESKLIFTEIDLEKLSVTKQKNVTIADCHSKYANDFELVYFNCELVSYDIDNSSEFNKMNRKIDKSPFVPSVKSTLVERCEEIFNIQINALAKRMLHTKAKALVIGVSGGLDSTLALLVCAKTCVELGLDRKMIKAVTMPGFGTTDRTYNNAVSLIKKLGATFREISIKDAVIQHFKDIDHDINVRDVTYENSQARERTKILMDVANQENGLVVGTGDLSELALGWATYNGDHMSMYGVNSSVPKTLIKHMIKILAEYKFKEETKDILYDILDTPVSPELLPPDSEGKISQKTEELVGPYELHDFFLYYVMRFGYRPSKIFFLAKTAFKDDYNAETIYKWLKNFYSRFFSQQFKRSCMPDGPKVGSISLSPRGDWRMPSDASVKIWMEDLEEIGF